ncbi:hypothetical protein B0J11DRAFT_528623, partial [Dendryphion nanum]
MSETMRAWIHSRAGLPSAVLSLSTATAPNGVVADSHVRVRISHSALNPGASIVMQILPFVFRGSPAVPEMDFSGTVVDCGKSVPSDRRLEVGTQVFGSIPVGQHVKSGCGSLSELVSVEHTSVFKKPSHATLEEVAGLGIAGATALELINRAGLKKGDAVLVHGASGGIGHLVLQMCRHEVGETGRVVAVCSGEHVAWVKELGCNEVIDYKLHAPVHKYLKQTYADSRFNAVIDAVGIQDLFNNCPSFLAEGKPFISVGPRAKKYSFIGILSTVGLMAQNLLWPRILGGVPRPYIQATGISNLEALRTLADMVEQGIIKVHIGLLVDMENAQQAYTRMLSGHAGGKIIVKVQDLD